MLMKIFMGKLVFIDVSITYITRGGPFKFFCADQTARYFVTQNINVADFLPSSGYRSDSLWWFEKAVTLPIPCIVIVCSLRSGVADKS